MSKRGADRSNDTSGVLIPNTGVPFTATSMSPGSKEPESGLEAGIPGTVCSTVEKRVHVHLLLLLLLLRMQRSFAFAPLALYTSA